MFLFDGEPSRFIARDMGDWFDVSGLLGHLNDLIAAKGRPERFAALHSGDQMSCVVVGHGQRMIDRTFNPGFKAKLHRKDMNIAVTAGEERGLALLAAGDPFAPASEIATGSSGCGYTPTRPSSPTCPARLPEREPRRSRRSLLRA